MSIATLNQKEISSVVGGITTKEVVRDSIFTVCLGAAVLTTAVGDIATSGFMEQAALYFVVAGACSVVSNTLVGEKSNGLVSSIFG